MGKSPHGTIGDKPRRHPLRNFIRVRIVAALTQKDLTQSDLVRLLRVPQRARQTIGRHLRALEEADYIRVANKEMVRGLQRYRYTASRPAVITNADFAEMRLSERKHTSMGVLMDFVAAGTEAWKKGTMDSQAHSHFTWMRSELDQQGFDEVVALVGRTYDGVLEIEAESLVRRRKGGSRLVPTIVSLAGFEGPPQDGS